MVTNIIIVRDVEGISVIVLNETKKEKLKEIALEPCCICVRWEVDAVISMEKK